MQTNAHHESEKLTPLCVDCDKDSQTEILPLRSVACTRIPSELIVCPREFVGYVETALMSNLRDVSSLNKSEQESSVPIERTEPATSLEVPQFDPRLCGMEEVTGSVATFHVDGEPLPSIVRTTNLREPGGLAEVHARRDHFLVDGQLLSAVFDNDCETNAVSPGLEPTQPRKVEIIANQFTGSLRLHLNNTPSRQTLGHHTRTYSPPQKNDYMGIPDADIELILSQTNATRSEAVTALDEADGDIVEAIVVRNAICFLLTVSLGVNVLGWMPSPQRVQINCAPVVYVERKTINGNEKRVA